MIDISRKSWLKYLLFGSLYFSEGLIDAIALIIVLVYLVEKGFSESVATLVTGVIMMKKLNQIRIGS